MKGDRLLLQGDHHYEYDEFGNLTADRYGKNQCREHLYQWDCEHRLVRFTDIHHYDYSDERHTITQAWNYRYDAFGRRYRKQDEETGKTTLFFWQDDRLVTECDEKDAQFDPRKVNNAYVKATDFDCTTYLYEPGSFRPLAQFKGRGRNGPVYWYINDHLGTPQELVDGKGNIVWSGLYRSYGEIAVQGGAVRQPLRFQGQYADEESGLHYNRYRYYNPLAGRYISQDPISIQGGTNTYAYVPNPLVWVDPLGLSEENQLDNVRAISSNIDPALKENLQCVEYASELENKMKNAGIGGTKIKVETRGPMGHEGYKNGNASISENGTHVLIGHDGVVFDNHHPQGIPWEEWKAGLLVTDIPTLTFTKF